MRTIAYIDGYNLYYGVLKHSNYKWLDLWELCNRLVNEQDPSSELLTVKFFTADVKANLSRHGNSSQHAQQTYHRALEARYKESGRIEIIKGRYEISKVHLHPDKNGRIDLENRVYVHKPEEKETDVNIALHMYRDAIEDRCDQQVLVGQDTDLCPALQFVRSLESNIRVGLICPRTSSRSLRPPSKSLSKYCDWTRQYIREEELQASQLPDPVPTRKKPAVKPDRWRS